MLFILQVSYITAVDVYFIVGFAFIFAAPLEFVLVLLNSGVKRHFRSSNDDSGNKKVILTFYSTKVIIVRQISTVSSCRVVLNFKVEIDLNT